MQQWNFKQNRLKINYYVTANTSKHCVQAAVYVIEDKIFLA